ncbi:MAG: NAD(P)/FAD-dependent oxidoreductase [Planctomycetota bacterium]|nr:NAD(P)/FAD-dependent oxidoreductase [Planctomycetota bacterium]
MQTRWDVIIVGGGAAGLWAAGTAAARGKQVLVLEKNNKAGVKILMSGGTRCNITHHCDSRKIAEAFGKNGRVLLSVLSRLSPQDVVRQIEQEGVATKVEETGKVFPASDRAIDVRDAIVRRLAREGASLVTGAAVQTVRPAAAGAGFEVVVQVQAQSAMNLTCDSVLLTTGGLSYSGCGTNGDGYPWAQGMGHTITSLRPALTPLLSHEAWVHELSGITLDDAEVTARVIGADAKLAKLERATSRGGLLWTHFGCSGPTAMNVSRCFSDLQSHSPASMVVDLLPDLSREACEQWLLDAAKESNRTITNVLSQRIPKRLASALVAIAGSTNDVHTSELSKKIRNSLVERLKALSVPIHGTRGYPKAEVTAGGVALGEVNFQDMQSRKTPGLFFAGEILDLDGPIGGFNFQAAWSTGHTAGLHV